MKIGWISLPGLRNYGDELVVATARQLHKKLFPKHQLHIGESFSFKPDITVVGGGTMIIPTLCRRMKTLADATRTVLLGCGVRGLKGTPVPRGLTPDPRLHPAVYQTLRRSKGGVRGPDSAKLLAYGGVITQIVGDLGFLYIQKVEKSTSSRTRVGVNVGATRGAVFEPERNMLKATANFINGLPDSVEVHLFPVWKGDVPAIKKLAARLGRPAHVISKVMSYQDIHLLLANMDFIVGMKLHVIVSAVQLGIPFASLSYQPKCIDFLRSINMEDADPFWNETPIMDLYKKSMDERDVIREKMAGHVVQCKKKLMSVVKENLC